MSYKGEEPNMKRIIKSAASAAQVEYVVVVTFNGYPDSEAELIVSAYADATEADLLRIIRTEYADELFEAEVTYRDSANGMYTVDVTYAGYEDIIESFDEYANSVAEACDLAIQKASEALTIDSFEII